MSAIRQSSDVWVVRDPQPDCGCVSAACMVTQELALILPAVNAEGSARHPTVWLSKAEAMRDFRSRARLWKALRRRWAANRKATLP